MYREKSAGHFTNTTARKITMSHDVLGSNERLSRFSSSSRRDDVSGSPPRSHEISISFFLQLETTIHELARGADSAKLGRANDRTNRQTDKRTDGRSRTPRETLLENAQFDMAESRIG